VNVEPSSATSGGGAGTGPAGRIIARTASSNEALPDPFTIARRGYVRFDRVRISQPIPRSAAIDQMDNVCVCRNARRVPSAELRGRAASLSPVSCTGVAELVDRSAALGLGVAFGSDASDESEGSAACTRMSAETNIDHSDSSRGIGTAELLFKET
jgi:hypothetical protein